MTPASHDASSIAQQNPFHIREATAQDAEYFRKWLPQALGGTPKARLGLATDAATGKVVGVAALRLFDDAVGRFMIFVDPAFRRRGCGSALLEIIGQVAKA